MNTIIQTVVQDVPQLQTIVQEGIAPISTIIDAPFVEVSSVNGMTGDVIVEVALDDFRTNYFYKKGTAVLYQGTLYYAKADFTSSSTFNPSDWDTPTFVQEQANWNESDTTSNAYIKNKPTIPTKLTDLTNDGNFVQDASYVHTDENYTNSEKTKLSGIESGAEVNVQANLDQTSNTADDFVKGQFVKRYRTTSDSATYGGGYVYLGSMRANDGGSNFSSMSIEGRVGGWVSTGNAFTINLLLANRNKAMAEGSVIGPSGALTNQFDIVAYQDTNATTGERTRWYLKQITSYATADITVRYQQPEDFNDKWVFTKSSTEPTGVQVYSLTGSIQAKDGKVLYYNTENGGIPTLVDLIYPVGSIYMSTTLSTAAQVEAIFGGTWQAWGAGRVPVGVDASDTDFDTVEETGGTKTNTHRHMTTVGSDANGYMWSISDDDTWIADGLITSDVYSNKSYGSITGSHTSGGTARLMSTHDTQINIQQKYITCYMYKRTA